MTFSEDIKSKHLSNYVLVTISSKVITQSVPLGVCTYPVGWGGYETEVGVTEEYCNSQNGLFDLTDPVSVATETTILHRLSTQKVTLDGDYYKPVLLNIPSISESLDIENRKYKISSVRLSISDYEEDGVRFSDGLNTLMNKEVNIYYASQSCKTLDECLLAGSYIIRSFTQDEDKVSLNCEDLSQAKLHKDLPLENLGNDDSVPDKYKNKPIPMVFGVVDRSPLVIRSINDLSQYTIIGDNEDIEFTEPESPLFALSNDAYLKVLHTSINYIHWGYESGLQYTVNLSDGIILTNTISNQIVANSILSDGAVEVVYNNKPISKLYTSEDNFYDASPDTFVNYPASFYGENVFINIERSGDATGTRNQYYIDYRFNSIPDALINDFGVKINWTAHISISDSTFVTNTGLAVVLLRPSFTDNIFDDNDYDDLGTNTYGASANMFVNNDSHIADKDYDEGFVDIFDEKVRIGSFVGFRSELSLGDTYGYGANVELNIDLDANINYLLKDFIKKDFYASVKGRGISHTAQDIYSHILGVDVLDFDGDLIQDTFSMGVDSDNYAFTIDKKINSKKLLEEISASSGLFPFFKNGNFNVKSIKKSYGETYNIIKAEDVLSYKFNRTSINKVYTKINVKYHYDYGLKEFTKETEYVTPTESGLYSGYSEDYFGAGFDQELVFESKYIRDETTALNLAKYLCGLHANQHNVITLTLPLNYLELELGDIVRMDKLIQGRKMFGEGYIWNTLRNGQIIYPYFFIDKIKKNLDKVEIRLYQLHQFDAEEGATDPVFGCTDSNATNYMGATIEDGSCIYQDNVVHSCTNPSALNYHGVILPEGHTLADDGSCLLPTDLLPPTIITPEEDFIVDLEFETIEGLSDNLIPNPTSNSSFDNNSAGLGETVWSGIVQQIGLSEYQGQLFIFDLLDIVPESLIGVTINNLTANVSGEITNAYYAPSTPTIAEHLIVSAKLNEPWTVAGSDYPVGASMIFVAGHEIEIASSFEVNQSSWLPSSNNIQLSGGDGTLIMQSMGSTLDSIYLETGQTLFEGEKWVVMLEIKRNSGSVSTIKVKLNNTVIADNIDVADHYLYYNINHTAISDISNAQLRIELSDSSNIATELEIGGVFLFRSTEEEGILIPPVLDVEFEPSLNLMEEIAGLPDYSPVGYYTASIFSINNDIETVHATLPNIPETADSQLSVPTALSIDFSEYDIPVNTELFLKISCTSTSTSNNGYVFNHPHSILPTASTHVGFSWGEINNQNGIMGDLNQDESVNVADIIVLITAILGEQEITPELLSQGDMNGDGSINVNDIIVLVNIILGNV